MYVCSYIHKHTCMQVSMCMHMHMFASAYTYTFVFMHECTQVCAPNTCMHLNTGMYHNIFWELWNLDMFFTVNIFTTHGPKLWTMIQQFICNNEICSMVGMMSSLFLLVTPRCILMSLSLWYYHLPQLFFKMMFNICNLGLAYSWFFMM